MAPVCLRFTVQPFTRLNLCNGSLLSWSSIGSAYSLEARLFRDGMRSWVFAMTVLQQLRCCDAFQRPPELLAQRVGFNLVNLSISIRLTAGEQD